MAKSPQPEEIDRYRLHAETSVEAMGVVLAALTRMGCRNIGYELITDIVGFTQNAPRKQHDTSAIQEVTKYVEDHPSFSSADIVKLFAGQGRTPGAAYNAIRVMVAAGSVIKLGDAQYQRAMKALPAPAKAAAASHATDNPKQRRKRGSVPQYETTNREFLIKCIGAKKRFTALALRAAFKEAGRNERSVSALITKFGQEKLLRPLGEGEWEMLKSPAEARKLAASSKPIGRPKHKNLNGATSEGVATHG